MDVAFKKHRHIKTYIPHTCLLNISEDAETNINAMLKNDCLYKYK